uniref:ATP-dependent zinc metalloprotease FtsH n=1 Tax=Lygus hesperus TaxID=30085 RepID=A0A0A9WDE3_LYGHE
MEKEIMLELPTLDKHSVHRDERWLRIFELIRDERARVLKEQNLSGGVELSDLEKARELLSLGVKRISFFNSAFDDIDRNRVAVARCGPAIVSMLTPGANKIQKMTIIPRGDQLGGMLVQQNSGFTEDGEEENDQTSITYEQLLISIRIHLAERVAEEIIFGGKSLSGESGKGLEKAYNLTQKMLTRWGFSTKNTVYSVPNLSLLSQLTRSEYDKEIDELLHNQKEIVVKMLKEHEEELRGLSDLLVRQETLTGEEIRQYLNTFKKEEKDSGMVSTITSENTTNHSDTNTVERNDNDTSNVSGLL